jgi:hypothetical protein
MRRTGVIFQLPNFSAIFPGEMNRANYALALSLCQSVIFLEISCLEIS